MDLSLLVQNVENESNYSKIQILGEFLWIDENNPGTLISPTDKRTEKVSMTDKREEASHWLPQRCHSPTKPATARASHRTTCGSIPLALDR